MELWEKVAGWEDKGETEREREGECFTLWNEKAREREEE